MWVTVSVAGLRYSYVVFSSMTKTSLLAAREPGANAWVLPEAITMWEGPSFLSECPSRPQDGACRFPALPEPASTL